MNRISTVRFVALIALVVTCFTGCKAKQTVETPAGPDYSHKLGPGQSALRLITDPNRMPDLAAAYRNRDWQTEEAIDRSLTWFAAPSSKTFYPFELSPDSRCTHEQARASLVAFQQLLQSSSDEAEFVSELKRKFNVYESVGYNGEGIVLFTGYYSPIFSASKTKSAQFPYPLYRRPADLASDPKTGKPLGRKMSNGQIVPYPTRHEIEQSNMLKGSELVWLEDQLSVYIVQVNGSAKLRMTDGAEMYIGYAGKTDRPYVGLGKSMLEEGLLKPNDVNLPAIRKVFDKNPARVLELIDRNESYVFFTTYPADKWPAGSLGVKVTDETTLATDKSIYPRGGLVMIDTQKVELTAGKKRFQRFMLDQDTGGAIQAPGRADIYMGRGSSAEILAGGQYSEGRLYYLFLKPEFLHEYESAPKVIQRTATGG